ncbi:MAG: hypothetical protein IJ265_08295, partial [Oscillospiraceae bacterium]|nr:hypothetical protein [Oscillospiraceae bacterium]
MSWYSTNDTFPSAVRQAQKAEGTVIHQIYRLGKALRVCGLELTYEAEDLRTSVRYVAELAFGD